MSNYIVGDIQGCFDELQLLLETVKFDKKKDTLWVAGDLVARGPKSLETLRFIRSLGESAKIVLGNHDLHLLAVSLGLFPAKKKDQTQPILDADDKDELLEWLREQPLMQEHDQFVMTHAGISPQWTIKRARKENKKLTDLLRSKKWKWLIENMYSNSPDLWSKELSDIERYRYAINSFTRMRFCFPDGRLDMGCKLPPKEVTDHEYIPWFDLPQRVQLDKTVLFGHWAALEGYNGKDVIGLDTGCVWGGELTALRWEDKQFFTQAAL
ncbi:symmetrical bis(5'-nucleosyl)-tetraphosphatase [Vibrio toranzoniae]|uniref:symmetrical bis(5'-nucleosyl)-tetraphosphatase n=1 Tax=Vibrio toranzoniae TaxID=1194427 RepID=UPI0013782748|nr:symmetrical bis(5'-nucleosyl)-tetraphosphatase [Vibrio toranzoniae]NAZ68265.1 symmetrical bis(5'-nucleosyl)-tetraphosphatase [Vibrio toranzoniae]